MTHAKSTDEPVAQSATSQRDQSAVNTPITPDELAQAGRILDAIRGAFSSRVVGQERLRESLVIAMLAEGHVLLESVPGLAKTLAASTLARAVDVAFSRIQCTPDLLPSDIIGTQVYDPRNHTFETQLGPVHSNFVLLDEINRASAKTQSAMLEAMQEGQTSIAGVVHPLPRPFMVLATQNPIEEEGTYVLPRAQMDRFLVKEVVDYPAVDHEVEVLNRIEAGTLGRGVGLDPVVGPEHIAYLHGLVARVYVDPSIKKYIAALVAATRTPSALPDGMKGYVDMGASPRGSVAFYQAARARALTVGRNHVLPEDVRELRHRVLRHRVHLSFEALAERVRVEDVIDAVVKAVPSP